jgi:arsenate reductase-like glutaredoxin family protein
MTTPATEVKSNDTELTPEQLQEMFNALPNEFRDAINNVNKAIAEHNANVESIKATEAKDPKLIKAEIFEQDSHGNKQVSRMYTEYLKLTEQAEKIRSQAYELIDKHGLMPKELTAEDIEKLKSTVTDSTKELREQVGALLKFEEMMPMFAGKITPHIFEIKTRRGAAKTTGTTVKGEGPKRIRFKRIEVNNVTEDDKGNKVYGLVNGEPKYTFTFASQYLRKQHKAINWSAKDLTDAYLSGQDENNLPEEREFPMVHTFNDANGNEQSVTYTVKCYR